jgi:hypothetical protein
MAREESIIYEGLFDAFNANSVATQNVKKVLQQTKLVAGTYGMKNIKNAVAKTEQNFEQSIANNKLKNRAIAISNATVFSDIMSDFFRNMDAWIMQLPTMAQALELAKVPENSGKTIGELLQADPSGGSKLPDATKNLMQIIQKQFEKSVGGFLKGVARFFTSGAITSASTALNSAELDTSKIVQDILGVRANQYVQLVQSGQQVPQVQIPQDQGNPESGTQKSVKSKENTKTIESQPTQATAPNQQAATTVGNTQATAKPSPDQASARDTKLQGFVRNRNAFNTQIMGSLSDAEVKSDILNIAKALGITLP